VERHGYPLQGSVHDLVLCVGVFSAIVRFVSKQVAQGCRAWAVR
jgi:hypothetical protein